MAAKKGYPLPPVNWLGRNGDEVEAVVAVLLSRRFPRAERIQASRGDGGIDVQVPEDDGWAIYQIKNYTNRFHKDKVEKSYNRIRLYAADHGLTVTSWSLIMPMNASKEARRWFTKLTKDAGFPCGIPGKIFVDNLAADYPDVIEYYWGDGRRELATLISQVANFRNTTERARVSDKQTPLRPVEVSSALTDIFLALNRCDPHFNYTFAVDLRMPSIAHEPGLIFLSTTGRSGCFVTYKVFPKYAAATEDRPILVRLRGAVEPGSADAEGIENFLNYGTPYSSVEACISLMVDAPGGLDASLPMGRVSLGPTAEEEAEPDQPGRLQVLDTAGNVLAETTILKRPPTTGPRRRGYRTIGRDRGGAFSFEHIIDIPEGNFRLTLLHPSMAGMDPTEVLAGFEVLASFHRPNLWRMGGLRGRITEDGTPITIEHVNAGWTEALEVIRALVDIQRFTEHQLTIPPLDRFLENVINDVLVPWHILQGQVATAQISKYVGTLRPDEATMVEGGPQNVTWTCPLVAMVDQKKVVLGVQRRSAQRISIDLTPLPDGRVRFAMTPYQSESFIMVRQLERPGIAICE